MTFEEAKKILKKEGFSFYKRISELCTVPDHFKRYENPKICKAMDIVNSAGYFVCMEMSCFDERKARLKKELEEHGNAPMPGPGEKQPKEKKGIIYPSTFPKADFYYKHILNEGNPALKEAASQFNDALLDEQAKKIEELTKEKTNLEDQITVLNACKEHNDKIDRKQIKRLGKEISKLNSIIHDKNAVLADVAEELRLSKIRENNLVEVSQKYMKENEELKKKLADKIVDEIDARALKSAESALAWKEKVIAEKDELIAEKDELIVNLDSELAATKKELEAFKESYKRRIKEDSEHFEDIQKICNVGLQKWLIETEYLEKDKPFRFPQLPELSEEEEKKLSLFRDDSVGAVTNQKDCSPVKDTHPTEDKPEEVELDEILECVRKALEDGHTVSIDYDKAEEGGDQSATIVQCDNGITLSKEEAEIIERCTKNGTELHYSEKDGLTYTNVFGEEMPIRCLRGMFHVFTDEEIENMKK